MLSSLFRPKRPKTHLDPPHSPYHDEVSPHGHRRDSEAADYFQRPKHTDADNSDDDEEEEEDEPNEDHDDVENEDGEGGNEESTPLLPIFSAAHLDALPIYNLTHSIRLLIIQRCETTLSWDQLRSPQISQFLVKPIQQDIQAQHFNRATIYVLIANCLQFNKESQSTPGNEGVLRTRGLVAELIAMRLLKEFSTRELIDCLAYDFNPLNGINPPESNQNRFSLQLAGSVTYELAQRQNAYRTSTLEVAIRAQAKRFLAHPSVVTHLEAVWAGNIVFHSAADSLHRYPAKPPLNQSRHYGATHHASSTMAHVQNTLQKSHGEIIRRSVTLYNPGDASIFKLSRLRVPRYRQIFSTLSYAIMLGLFLATLVDRPLDITAMEVVFWFWSSGFMLDEIVGFSEQGFGLYMVSVWNAFDVGILLMFMIYYVLRLYGIIIADTHKRRIANMAYDVLASTAILLFPRLFSVLDHYKYFSQLLIAFRMMSIDLVAILVLLIISCSGFFVAFSLSFGDNALGGPDGVIYALFQIVMGFTPAAWVVWDEYNFLGKALLAMFLIICHFLIVTILITVLTNSFMKVVQNANEEHQYLFAVNTISMVKSDALFTYIAPSNILGWLCSPIRYIVPFRQFVKINRTVIKITHFPVLFSICAYERLMLGHYAWEPAELVDQRGRRRRRLPTFAMNANHGPFSPGVRVREPSVTTYYKDRALDEVFRRPFTGDTSTIRKTNHSTDRRSNVVDKWMNGINEGGASSPMEQPRSILEHLENKRPGVRRAMTLQNSMSRRRPPSTTSRSVLSDPEQRRARNARRRPQPISEEDEVENTTATTNREVQTTDAEGDDERAETGAEDSIHLDNDTESNEHTTSTDEDGNDRNSSSSQHVQKHGPADDEDDEDTPTPTGANPDPILEPISVPSQNRDRLLGSLHENTRPTVMPMGSFKRGHKRNSSTNTIVFHPDRVAYDSSSTSSRRNSKAQPKSRPGTGTHTPRDFPVQPRLLSKRTPTMPIPNHQRPGMVSRDAYKSTPNVARFLELASRENRRAPSMGARALDLASDIGDNRPVLASILNDEMHFLGPLPHGSSSFHDELAARRASADEERRVGRMVMARMNTLEEGFKDILKEVKEWRNVSSRGTSAGEEVSSLNGRRLAKRMERKKEAGEGLAQAARHLDVVPPPRRETSNVSLQELGRPRAGVGSGVVTPSVSSPLTRTEIMASSF